MAASDDDDLDDILDSALDGFDVAAPSTAPANAPRGAAPAGKDGAGAASAADARSAAEAAAADDALRAFEDALKPLSGGAAGENDEEVDMQMVAEFVKSFEKLGILGDAGVAAGAAAGAGAGAGGGTAGAPNGRGAGAGASGGAGAGGGAATEIESAIKSLISDVLSKDVLQEPMSQIRDSLSRWLGDNASTLSDDDRTRHQRQLSLVSDICAEFDASADSARVIDLLASLKDCGKLPSEVMSELPDDEEGEGVGVGDSAALPADLQQLASNCPVQ